MHVAVIMVLSLLWSMPSLGQGADSKLLAELEALHAKWFQAFDNGDGATMDQMEMDNLTLVMPVGFVWTKTEPRAGTQPKRDSQSVRTWSDATVRRFGDTAILTGVVTAKSGKEETKDGTTVVFVQSGGKWKIASAQWTPVLKSE